MVKECKGPGKGGCGGEGSLQGCSAAGQLAVGGRTGSGVAGWAPAAAQCGRIGSGCRHPRNHSHHPALAASPRPPPLFVGLRCPSALLSLTPGLSVSVLAPQKGLFSYPGMSSRRRREQTGQGAQSGVGGSAERYTPVLGASRKPKGWGHASFCHQSPNTRLSPCAWAEEVVPCSHT